MLKMVMIVYNEALEPEIKEILEKAGSRNYTEVTNVFGRGNTSGTHESTDIWPGRNSLMYVACQDKEAAKIMTLVRDLRKTLGKEGVKAFLQPLEDLT